MASCIWQLAPQRKLFGEVLIRLLVLELPTIAMLLRQAVQSSSIPGSVIFVSFATGIAQRLPGSEESDASWHQHLVVESDALDGWYVGNPEFALANQRAPLNRPQAKPLLQWKRRPAEAPRAPQLSCQS